MKRRLLYFVIGMLVGMVGGYLYLRHRPAPPPAFASSPAVRPTTNPPLPEVAIQEGKTIDFSSGTPEIRDTPEDRAALENAKAEMDEAVKDVVFAPTKPAEPAPAAAAAEAERKPPNPQR